MKISNADIVRLTEIKQYLLDPPHSFKLHREATGFIEETLSILNKYAFIETPFYDSFDVLRNEVAGYEKDPVNLRATLIKLGKLMGGLFNR
ncbi:hypothetical protein HNQ91_005686 [Filimonas zeae]|uniref:Uncharacterized protein n=1 Tax=Filimonas zeae TaxID=1737353 RepID=A0A917J484_9BACT|nr:hypothetical protein [Filimonas zeae]MDR6342602.1 hypothetical protein [Filimonas zeae]GGH81964.1 hypothetical protein GCM10011379_55150 [Filimonas zeae]